MVEGNIAYSTAVAVVAAAAAAVVAAVGRMNMGLVITLVMLEMCTITIIGLR